MIEVAGPEGTAEHEAGQQLAAAFSRLWPDLAAAPAEEAILRIASGVKLSGYKVSDIDLVVAASFDVSKYIVPKGVFLDHEGKKVSGAKVAVRSFIAAIEVKDHDAHGVRIEAGGVSVRYKEGWKSATEQNDLQRYALKDYLKDQFSDAPFVYRCVMLRGLPALPRERGKIVPASGAIAADFDATSLLMAMATVKGIKKTGNGYLVSSGNAGLLDSVLHSPLFKKVVPTRLDRARMDRISARPPLARELGALLGESRVHLRGKGGTGKTVLLLQAAKEAFEQYGKRCLLLTYNHALAADIQRLLALMGIPASADRGGVDVRTVMSFVYAWLSQLGLMEEGEELDYDDYGELCKEALSMVSGGVVTGEDIAQVKSGNGGQFDYDVVIVDEAQDWPQQEADLVGSLYGGNRISIADGIDQLVRGRPTDWARSIGGQRAQGLHSFRECLRMKANLTVFANAVAARSGLSWQVEPNTQAAGGRVLVSRTEYAGLPDLRESLLDSAKRLGNSEVDFLHCVPPSGIETSGNQRVSSLARALKKEGGYVWDGVDPIVRRDYPRDVSESRIVQYESCRGLEGWVVVLDGLDEFWERKRAEALASLNAEKHHQGMLGPEGEAETDAWRWVMIALTRPIDTLVITIRDPDSALGKAIYGVAREIPDIVELV